MINIRKNIGIIYCITNLTNNKKYIGQTIGKLQNRINHHFSLSRNLNKNTAICQAIRKYGEENFEWVILDIAFTRKELDEKEVYWIKYYNTYGHDGYNSTLGGQKIRTNLINPKERENFTTRANKTPFLIFDLQGNYISETINQNVFAEKVKTSPANINKVLSNQKNSIKGYILMYKDEFTEEKLQKRINKTRDNRIFHVFDFDYNYIGSWKNQTECGIGLNIVRSNISKCLTGVRQHINGYYFYYDNDCPKELLLRVS